MSVYAVLSSGVVVNTVVWDGTEPFSPGGDAVLVIEPSDVGIGWTFDGTTWIAPPPSPRWSEEPPSGDA